ncbi:MAG TPA: response regulator transcription factor [Polyangiales bacterium]|jgi:DNA-binding response OmpR family regulator|nr:response regulator transcription factor [Polyangiales bacterium]
MNKPAPPKVKVLVVEDDPDVRGLIVRALSFEYEVVAAEDANKALALLAAPPAPGLIISDIMMPGLDGLDFAKQVKHTAGLGSVPIIFLTAKTTPKDTIAGIKAGARLYVAKPFRVPDLLEKVRKVAPPTGIVKKPTMKR